MQQCGCLIESGNRILCLPLVKFGVSKPEPSLCEIRLDRERFVISSKGFVVALEIVISIAATEPGALQIRLDRERFVISSKGFGVALEVSKNIAATEPSLCEIRFDRERFVA